MKLPKLFAALVFALGVCVGGAQGQEASAISVPGAEGAKQALEASPRHGEFVQVPVEGSETKLRAFVAFPEQSEKAPVVIVIHEIFGLSEWIQSVADAFAAEGFIAIAPDLITGIPGAEENPRAAIGELSDEEAVKRLNATLAYAKALPAANGKAATVGFCWGGRMSFHYAIAQPELSAAVVYYGTSPETSTLAGITVPVLGLYAEDDARVNTTIPPAEEEMKRLEKSFEKEIYAGAGHGFLRQQDGRDGANKKASDQAWPRTLAFLREHMK